VGRARRRVLTAQGPLERAALGVVGARVVLGAFAPPFL
jgi:hypothetical protein